MRNRMRRKYQTGLTKMLRKANKSLREDDLWRGRFYILQRRTIWEEFADDSGGILHAQLRLYDKMTGFYKDYIYEYAPWRHTNVWNLYMEIMNTFIVDDVDAWEDDPRNDKTDYNKIPYIQNDRRKNNYFLGREVFFNEKNKV